MEALTALLDCIVSRTVAQCMCSSLSAKPTELDILCYSTGATGRHIMQVTISLQHHPSTAYSHNAVTQSNCQLQCIYVAKRK